MVRGDPVLVLQQQLQEAARSELGPPHPRHGLPDPWPPSRRQPLTLCVLTSSPTVMYTMGLATATMSEYSSIAKRSSGSGTWQALHTNFLTPGWGWGCERVGRTGSRLSSDPITPLGSLMRLLKLMLTLQAQLPPSVPGGHGANLL